MPSPTYLRKLVQSLALIFALMIKEYKTVLGEGIWASCGWKGPDAVQLLSRVARHFSCLSDLYALLRRSSPFAAQ
jgi:hypothetical protein